MSAPALASLTRQTSFPTSGFIDYGYRAGMAEPFIPRTNPYDDPETQGFILDVLKKSNEALTIVQIAKGFDGEVVWVAGNVGRMCAAGTLKRIERKGRSNLFEIA